MLFVCPKCKEKLNIQGVSAVCKNGHTYDRNKKGFYNLFLSNTGGVHGDNKLMVESRRRFLDGGYYDRLAEKVASLVCEHTPHGGAVLDIGCGEGYYTSIIERRLAALGKTASVAGFDISKEAVAFAKRRNAAVEFAVAGAYDMPLADKSVDTAVNMFSPLAPAEIFRVLKPSGIFIMAIPAEEHLFGLKELLYDTPYKNTVADTALDGFELVADNEVRYTLSLADRDDISALFGMTPYAYRTGSIGRERIEHAEQLVTDAHFRVFVYRCLNRKI